MHSCGESMERTGVLTHPFAALLFVPQRVGNTLKDPIRTLLFAGGFCRRRATSFLVLDGHAFLHRSALLCGAQLEGERGRRYFGEFLLGFVLLALHFALAGKDQIVALPLACGDLALAAHAVDPEALVGLFFGIQYVTPWPENAPIGPRDL